MAELSPDEDSRDRVERASRGDALAVERVLAAWSPVLEAYLRRRSGPRLLERESAADLAQSVCREALERLGRGELEYRGDAEMRKWLLGAADLKIRGRLRRYGAAKRGDVVRVDDDAGPPLDELARARDPSPSHAAMGVEERAAFHAALARLDERQREVIQLFHFEGLTHAAIAARLGLEESHSRTLLARSLARLTQLMRAPE
ncbi:MAG: sigma-70 family RNA polymerase sigma factor [Planctomycetota bacterium]